MSIAATDKALLKDRAYSEIKRFIYSHKFLPPELMNTQTMRK